MASAVPRNDRVIISENFDQRLRRRAVAAWQYYSGNAKRNYLEQHRKEQQPWRILRYTHILDPKTFGASISRSDFTLPSTLAFHLYYLRRHCLVISLEQLLEKIEANEAIAPNTVVITFDGGFETFYTYAFPLLQQLNLPATIFLPTAFIGSNTIFWHDKITIGLLNIARLGHQFPAFTKLPPNFFTVLEQMTQSRAISSIAIGLLQDALLEMSPEDRFYTVAELGAMLQHLQLSPTFPRFMSWEQISHIDKDARVTFGSMTHGHKILPELPNEELGTEISQSYAALSNVKHLKGIISLPYGISDKTTLERLPQHEIRYALGRAPLHMENVSNHPLALLGRVAMFDDASFCPEIFVCRLWGLKFGSFRF